MIDLVSVVIPTYNCESYIAETIDSVLAQDYPYIELFIIDDGSTDKTLDIVKRYGDRLKLICQTNSGVCVARNKGIKEATGQYICLMDHDDYWYPNKLSQQIITFNKNLDSGVVYSAFTMWYPDATGRFPPPSNMRGTISDNEVDLDFSGWIYHLLLLHCSVLTSTAMFRAEVFARCGVFDEALPYSEDWDLWLRIAREFQFIKLQQATTLYRQHLQQGNKKVRDVDYRTVLLRNAVKKWGLSSPDGRSLSRWQFKRQLAEYHAAYGLHHLQAGSQPVAVRSLFTAWLTFPLGVKYVAYIVASFLGWRPNW